jgi:hypothetical protein
MQNKFFPDLKQIIEIKNCCQLDKNISACKAIANFGIFFLFSNNYR